MLKYLSLFYYYSAHKLFKSKSELTISIQLAGKRRKIDPLQSAMLWVNGHVTGEKIMDERVEKGKGRESEYRNVMRKSRKMDGDAADKNKLQEEVDYVKRDERFKN